jgi:hypothetical protein
MSTNRAPEISLYKGCPVITVWTGRLYKGEEEFVTLGPKKAAAVCDQIDYIRRFVEQTEGKTSQVKERRS